MDNFLKSFQESLGDGHSVSFYRPKNCETIAEFEVNGASYKVTSAKLSDSEFADLKKLLNGFPETVHPTALGIDKEKARFFAEALMSFQIEKTVKSKGRTQNWETFSPITQVLGNHNGFKLVYGSEEAKGLLNRAMGLSH